MTDEERNEKFIWCDGCGGLWLAMHVAHWACDCGGFRHSIVVGGLIVIEEEW